MDAFTSATRVGKEGHISWCAIDHDFARILQKPRPITQRRRRPFFRPLIAANDPLFLAIQAPKGFLAQRRSRSHMGPHGPQESKGPQALQEPQDAQELKDHGARRGQRARKSTESTSAEEPQRSHRIYGRHKSPMAQRSY